MNGMSAFNGRHQPSSNPILVLEPINDTFALKSLELPEQTKVKIGRQTGVTTAPHPSNGYFDSKVLSRVHAEVWSESGKVFIRDLKSSNGTFLNGRRLCPENTESEAFELNQNDSLEFGIDIMDENGACNSHAKIKPISPSGSGGNSVRMNSAAIGGQSENIDLIISRLQNELTRSQETYADLGFLKHSLGELEKAIVFNGDDRDTQNKSFANTNGRSYSMTDASSTDYEKRLEQKDKEHAAEIARLVKGFEETKAEMERQRERELQFAREENESARRAQERANVALNDAASKMDFIMTRINNMIKEHEQELDIVQKERAAALVSLATMEAKHKDELNRLVLEADAEQEGLTRKHERELAEAVAQAQAEAGKTTDAQAQEADLISLREEIKLLREAGEGQSRKVETLTKENKELSEQLNQVKAELKIARDEAKGNTAGGLDTLALTLDASGSNDDGNRNGNNSDGDINNNNNSNGNLNNNGNSNSSGGVNAHTSGVEGGLRARNVTGSSKAPLSTAALVTASMDSGSGEGEARREFSWPQFVFPMGKRNPTSLSQVIHAVCQLSWT
ncbi:hypothetical protein BGZ54_007319 [Gamsiella multidivaricata]|nr:hypothetical protein BGZ54_007319 [Gamsiella multidivaricata]